MDIGLVELHAWLRGWLPAILADVDADPTLAMANPAPGRPLLLYPRPNRQSFYTYLGRLRSQGLLERLPHARRGRLAYRITPRGRDRLVYLQGQIQR